MRKTDASGRITAAVRAEMARAGITQMEMSRRIPMTQQAISRRLSGHVSFTVDELAMIADYLGVPLSTLISDAVPADRAVV